jgi:RNA ligase (TIGR02306 family)
VENETKSTHKVEVLPIKLEKHGNADSLSVCHPFGYTVCTRTEDWNKVPDYDAEGKKLAAYVVPDSLLDVSRPEFAFLEKDARYQEDSTPISQSAKTCKRYTRIKAKKLRGIVSFGFILPAPEGSKPGDDVAELLGVKHYEPQPTGGSRGGIAGFRGEAGPAPQCYTVTYDVEAFRRYASEVFTNNELVNITEKIHGANSRYVFNDETFYCGSRTEWKKRYCTYKVPTIDELLLKGVEQARAEEIIEKIKRKAENPEESMWWTLANKYPQIEEFCKKNPGYILYGEAYGNVQDLKYGAKPGEILFAAFDVLAPDGHWLNHFEARELAAEVPWVPTLVENFPYNFDKICELAEGKSMVLGADHIREGCVVCPVVERVSNKIGRVKLKVVGAGYLERS